MRSAPSSPAALVTLRVLHGALLAALAAYAALLQVAAGGDTGNPELGRLLVPVLGAAAAAELAAIVVLRRRLLGSRRELRGAGDPGAPAPSPAGLARLQVVSVLSWALAEAIAIDGLVLGFLLREPEVYWAFAAVAAATLLVTRPRLEDLSRATQAAGASAAGRGR